MLNSGNLGGPLLVTIKIALFLFSLTLRNIYNKMPLLEITAVCSYITGNCCQRRSPFVTEESATDSCAWSVCFETMHGSIWGVLESMGWRNFRVHRQMLYVHKSRTVLTNRWPTCILCSHQSYFLKKLNSDTSFKGWTPGTCCYKDVSRYLDNCL